MKFSVIGAGNGGQAIAGYLGLNGYSVNLYDRNTQKIETLRNIGGIHLDGLLKGFGKVDGFYDNLKDAISSTDIIMVATVANAHKELAEKLSPILSENQIIILNPGRTCGALEFRETLRKCNCNKKIIVAEAQSLVYACRAKEIGLVNIIGIKDEVLMSTIPSADIDYVISKIKPIYSCFVATYNSLRTSLENIGAIFHPCIILFNAATIERGNEFYFYRDMTARVADFIEQFDNERISVGKEYGLELIHVRDWISYAYKGTSGNNLYEKMKSNPAYYNILAPSSIYTRQLIEDIPTGIIPICELGQKAGLEMKLFESIINISTCLLNIDFKTNGRTLKNLGLSNFTKQQIINYLK